MRGTPGLAVSPRLQLTAARLEWKWSQREVADRIGTTTLNVSRWERGLTRPGPYFRGRLCSLFAKSEQELDLAAQRAVSVGMEVAELYDPAIPLQTLRLVGRDREQEALKRWLDTGKGMALTALNGLPGVGKTALAITLAHDQELRARFPDGVLWAGLGPEPHIRVILSRWGTLLGLSPKEMATLNNSEVLAIALRRAIGSRAMFLVIDDAWCAEDALAFKVGGPNCAYLVTTRFPNIAAEVAVDGGTMTLGELGEDDSMRLLRMLAPRAVDREEQKALDLVHAVGGLPLALTLMGNYLRVRGQSGQARRIDVALERLQDAGARLWLSEPQAPVERHPSLPSDTPLSLQSVFTVTEAQLNEQARAALYALSVFPSKPHSFSEQAALAVADCTPEHLDMLFDSGLLESTSPGRYTLHQTVADYARLHVEGSAATERLIAYCSDFAEAHRKEYEHLESEIAVILVALEQAQTLGEWSKLIRCTCAIADFLIARGFYTTAERHVRRTHDAALLLQDRYGIATALLYLGQIAVEQSNYSQAEAYLEEGLSVARALGDPDRICAVLKSLGTVTWLRGEYARTETYIQEGLALARHLQDSERISGMLKVLGAVVASLGNFALSKSYLEEGLSVARALGDREQICALLMDLGVTFGEQGEYAQADTYFQEALLLARGIGHREKTCAVLSNLGEVASGTQQYARAEAYLQEGLTIARQIDHVEWTCVMFVNLGMVARKQSNFSQAKEYLEDGLTLARRIGLPVLTINVLNEYGNLLCKLAQPEAATAIFQEMLTTAPEGDQHLTALAYFGLAQVAAAQGMLDEAHRYGEASASVLEAIGHRQSGEVQAWLNTLPS